MKSASVSEAKNGLSALLEDVRHGETVLITHRGKPVARIESCSASGLAAGQAEAELVQAGIADPPRARLDLERFLAAAAPRLPDGHSASRLIAVERQEGR